MPRVKRGKIKTKKREKLLKETKGFKWGRKSRKKLAKEAVLHKLANAFKGRKEKKRVYRNLWNVRINAGARKHGLNYSKFLGLLKKKNINLNRKSLSNLAKDDPKVFESVVDLLKSDE